MVWGPFLKAHSLHRRSWEELEQAGSNCCEAKRQELQHFAETPNAFANLSFVEARIAKDEAGP
jgi:hypothetical protein